MVGTVEVPQDQVVGYSEEVSANLGAKLIRTQHVGAVFTVEAKVAK